MSVANPLLRELKGYILKLTLSSSGTDYVTTNNITDSNEYLRPLCLCIEKILYSGLVSRKNTFGSVRNDAWFWLDFIGEKHRNLPYAFKAAWTEVKYSKRVRRHLGRLRLLIRTCLVTQCLHIPVEIIVKDRQYTRQFYHPNTSILGDEMLGEVLLSALHQCSRLPFKLDLKNALFLDDTWLLPAIARHEFVPCRCLGFSIAFVQHVSVIIDINPQSIAYENENIEVGDLLDEINGTFINTETQGKLSSIMKTAAKTLTPVVVTIVKAHYPSDGKLYHPMGDILQQVRLDPSRLEILHKERFLLQNVEEVGSEETKTKEKKKSDVRKTKGSAPQLKPGFRVIYLGKVSAGVTGKVKQLGPCMTTLLSAPDTHLKEAVFIECQELEVKVTSQTTPEVVLKHSYMEISACGRALKYPLHFGYIAGDDGATCLAANTFTLYIFRSEDEKDIDQILLSIAQGFKRTHFAV